MAAFQQAIDADAAAQMIEAMRTVDVSADLARITAPTLVVHGRNDKAIPFELGRDIASAIPGAQFFPHDGGHQTFDPVLVKQITDAIQEFTNPAAKNSSVQPVDNTGTEFVTVLFTDIVGHTEMMLRLGDAAGREVLREHERITREVLSQHSGTEVKTMGDGFMASFTSATRAVECAVSLQRAYAHRNESSSEPILVRVGLNAGEPIKDDGDLFGATVILASRVAAVGGAGDILLPEPLRHILAGKDFAFSDRGSPDLKGFPESIRVFAVAWRG